MKIDNEKAVTSADKTFITLRDAIVEGVIPAGSKLSETELSTNYQVSRAVVREAINRVESCRLVERKANVGARVVELTQAGLVEIYQIRAALEGMAARLAATNMSENEVEDLSQLLQLHEQKIKLDKSYYQQAGDVDFHYRIIVGSKNNHLINLLVHGIYHLVRMYRVQYGMSGPRVTTALGEHLHIVQAIKNRDGELAELLMRRHIMYSKDNIKTKLAFNKG